MIEGLNGALMTVAPVTASPEGPAGGPLPRQFGWSSLGLGGSQGGAASIGQGAELGWARSWSDLSSRMRSVGVELDALGSRLSVADASPAAITANLNQMLKASKHLSEVSIQFQLASGLVTNAATGVNRLLTQQ